MTEISEIECCESDLRDAMLNSDIDALDRLLSDRLIFTNQDGARLAKSDDMALHRSGLLTIERIDPEGERIIRRLGDSALVWLTAEIAGRYEGQPFSGTFAYSRLWHRSDGRWQVELAHCSFVGAAG